MHHRARIAIMHELTHWWRKSTSKSDAVQRLLKPHLKQMIERCGTLVSTTKTKLASSGPLWNYWFNNLKIEIVKNIVTQIAI